MHVVYKISFEDGTKEFLVLTDDDVYLHNRPEIKTNQGGKTPASLLAIAIGYLFWNYKKIVSISGDNKDFLQKAFEHSEHCRDLIKFETVYDSFGIVRYVPVHCSPIIPDEINLEGVDKTKNSYHSFLSILNKPCKQ